MSRVTLHLSPEQKAEVETLAAVLNASQIADYFGIGRTTFYRLMNQDPEIEERYKRGKARVIGTIAQSLIAKARAGDTTSMIFYLKTQAGWRETAREEAESEDPQHGDVDLSSLSDAALLEMAETLYARCSPLIRTEAPLLASAAQEESQ